MYYGNSDRKLIGSIRKFKDEPPAAGRRGLHAKRRKLPASRSTEAGTTAETPKQKEPRRVETTMVAPVETTKAADVEAKTE